MSPVDKNTQKPAYWRSLAEYDDASEFRRNAEHEFPEPAEDILPDSPQRRHFMQLMGASFALAGGATGCRWEEDKILPHTRRPEGHIPGEPKYFATLMDLGGVATGLLAKSYDGRPIKLEGNPQHPGSRGACNIYHQASVLDLYDPDRSKEVARYAGGRRVASTWAEFEKFAAEQMGALRQRGGAGLRVLAEVTSSPSVAAMAEVLRARVFPQARWYDYDPVGDDNARLGTAMALGSSYRPLLALEKAKVIVSLESDFLSSALDSLPLAADFAKGREPESGSMSRLYVVESAYSPTGGVADHRLPLRSELIKAVAAALDADISAKAGASPALGQAQPRPQAAFLQDPKVARFLEVVVAELLANRGQSALLVGASQPPEVHAIVARLNALLGNVGATVTYIPDRVGAGGQAAPVSSRDAIKALAAEMAAGQVDTLIILGGNPAYNAPTDVGFAEALGKVKVSIRLGLHEDETSRLCTWHLPATHYLEAWGDGRAYEGTVGIAQPLIAPLYAGKSAIELLALLIGDSTKDGQQIVRRTLAPYVGDDRGWRRAVHDGVVQRRSLSPVQPGLQALPAYPLSERELGGLDVGNGQLELVFGPDSKVYDGRFANNGWLQELPDMMTKLTWDNAALISPATAKALGIEDEELVVLEVGGKSVKMPALLSPGQAKGSVKVALGYGRTAAGVIGFGGYLEHGALDDVKALVAAGKLDPVGVDVYGLRTTERWHFGGGLSIKGTGQRYKLATTQEKHAIDAIGQQGIDERLPSLVREATLEEYRANPRFAAERVHHPPLLSLWQEPVAYDGQKWGMSIDLNKCTGCNACVIACQAENNISIVGKERVAMGREMAWLRIDRYFQGEPENPRLVHQPLTCHQCEHAPCEEVCPVGATMHSREGLNDMVYNRCIGTRYCSNNCPYKVRRFNYFNMNEDLKQPEKQVKTMVFNPEVTLRFRGVMEKCTFCVQRIQAVKIKAKNARRSIDDGEIRSACQQTCPTGAIVFGDLNNPQSQVTELQNRPRSYAMLEELNVRPRLRYLARVRNPSPELEPAQAPAAHGGGPDKAEHG